MNWDDLKVFLAVAQCRGLKKAATQLRIHHTSCARRIKALEKQLGAKLFDRLPGGYTLTQAGEDVLYAATKIQEEFNAIEFELTGKDTRLEGDICMTIPNGFATHFLMPDISEFMALYPGVNLEINMTYAFKDLANREADIAIRHVESPPEFLAGKRIGRVYRSAYASENYLETHDPIHAPKSCHWLGWGEAKDHLKWAGKRKFSSIPIRGNLYSDVLQLSAIKEDMGIASLPCFIADKEPGIRRIPNAEVVPGDWIWILAHKDMMTNARVRVLMDFIANAFERQKNLLEGRANVAIE